jgi:hypothetical protein
VSLEDLCHSLGLGWIPNLPRGCIVGAVDVVDCLKIMPPPGPTSGWQKCWGIDVSAGSIEAHLGDYTLGRFAWIGANHKALAEPITCQGRQGLWTVSSVEAAVLGGEGMGDHA